MIRPRPSLCLPSVLLALLPGCAGAPATLPDHGPAVRVGQDGLALDGFDPVAYHLQGAAVPGSPEHVATHAGARYRFASAEHRARFLADPERYLPAYGGWCAWALADGAGSLVEVDPRSFLVQGDRLLLFYDGVFADTRAAWLGGDAPRLEERADRNWERMLDERGGDRRPAPRE